MTSDTRKKNLAALERRRVRLVERVANYRADGDQGYTRAELRAINYALSVLDAAQREDVLVDLEQVAGL